MSLSDVLNYIFPHDGIYEVIVSTYGVNENISPLGLIRNGNELYFKIYSETLTYSNLEKNPECCIHITNDPLYFYITLFNKQINYKKIKNFLIIPNTPLLISKCEIIDKSSNPRKVLIRPIEFIGESSCRAYSRGDALFIDLLVHITRLNIYNKQELKKYLEIISYEMSVVERISPQLKDAINELKELVSSFRIA